MKCRSLVGSFSGKTECLEKFYKITKERSSVESGSRLAPRNFQDVCVKTAPKLRKTLLVVIFTSPDGLNGIPGILI